MNLLYLYLVCLFFLPTATCSNHYVQAQDHATRQQQIDPAGLVRNIFVSENKVHDLESFYLRMKGKCTRTPEGLSAMRDELRQSFPEDELTSDTFVDLRPETSEELEVAFDGSRSRNLFHIHDALYMLNIWDGSRAIYHQNDLIGKDEQYGFGSTPGTGVLDGLTWLQAGPHSFWWRKDDPLISIQINGVPEDYEYDGPKNFRGCKCYVLLNRRVRRRLYVNVEDQRLRGLAIYYVPTNTNVDLSSIYRRFEGKTNDEPFVEKEWSDWFKNLPEKKRKVVQREVATKYFEFAVLQLEYYLEDYREIDPDFWFPMKQGYSVFGLKDKKPFVEMNRDFTTEEVRLNEPLRDDLFKVDLRDGVQVSDSSHDLPLFYKYKQNRTEEEWKQIVEKHKAEQTEKNKHLLKQQQMIGKSPMEFPDSIWLNSEPLTWESVRGKVVILDFWAEWCGPCRGEFPGMNNLYANRKKNNLVVIGIHTAGSELQKVRDMVDQYDLEYPIIVDVSKSENEKLMGKLQDFFQVNELPSAVVINAEGKVAKHGRLSEMVKHARKLTTSTPARNRP